MATYAAKSCAGTPQKRSDKLLDGGNHPSKQRQVEASKLLRENPPTFPAVCMYVKPACSVKQADKQGQPKTASPVVRAWDHARGGELFLTFLCKLFFGGLSLCIVKG